jgi:hypothetical protein
MIKYYYISLYFSLILTWNCSESPKLPISEEYIKNDSINIFCSIDTIFYEEDSSFFIKEARIVDFFGANNIACCKNNLADIPNYDQFFIFRLYETEVVRYVLTLPTNSVRWDFGIVRDQIITFYGVHNYRVSKIDVDLNKIHNSTLSINIDSGVGISKYESLYKNDDEIIILNSVSKELTQLSVDLKNRKYSCELPLNISHGSFTDGKVLLSVEDSNYFIKHDYLISDTDPYSRYVKLDSCNFTVSPEGVGVIKDFISIINLGDFYVVNNFSYKDQLMYSPANEKDATLIEIEDDKLNLFLTDYYLILKKNEGKFTRLKFQPLLRLTPSKF